VPTIHLAESSPHMAVAVDGQHVLAVGVYEELLAAHPQSRVRTWPGILTQALLNAHGPELLEQAYHPDPREADEFGTEPVTDLSLVELDDARWGASARRGLQRMLAHGTVALAGELTRPVVVEAVQRSGLTRLTREEQPEGQASLDPFATGGEVVRPLPISPGHHARFAIFDVRDERELAERGAGTCVATILDGRLMYRRR
jgi:hypothetical protein